MVSSLAFIFLLGLCFAALFAKLKLPRIIGMLFSGILMGPYVLNLLEPTILEVSPDLRQIALIIILLKAGLSLNVVDLKKVGRPAVLLSFVPACFEIIGFIVLAPVFFQLSVIEAALMGTVLAAVSPAVIVPRMVRFIEEGYGTEKSIPQLILAGASADDVFVIVLFSTVLGLAQGKSVSATSLTAIPISIVLGIALGVAVGYLLAIFFEAVNKRGAHIRNSTKVVVLLGFAFLLVSLESWLKGVIPLSGLLAVMSMAIALQMKTIEKVTKGLSEKFSKLWIGAELLLFVLVGAAVDIRYAAEAGFNAILLILLALCFRILGVFICLLGTQLNKGERLFCMIAYMPKATVQAAIGGVPLAMGLPCGSLILTVAVVSILVTAPLGAFAIDRSHKKLLSQERRRE
ncbi:cation:proton antiporter [Anaerotignum sp. MB30-C6]|uniref:cation:proton antiporter n=1 Tax=Anaerotignum sp. MB30-C6 TaxID=3070814 RepID=UPI0027DB8026|nr:cation:proton antiporter [Anaerotignum sp. MB30-C6]WMI81389.1 cation:proton antiporter [Anaerotignum sp. MB30-C6]